MLNHRFNTYRYGGHLSLLVSMTLLVPDSINANTRADTCMRPNSTTPESIETGRSNYVPISIGRPDSAPTAAAETACILYYRPRMMRTIAKSKMLDDMADLFMQQSAHLSDVRNAYMDTTPDAWSCSDTDDDVRPRTQRRRLRPRSHLKVPSRLLYYKWTLLLECICCCFGLLRCAKCV